uniref:Hypothethical protein n=1 Tax=Ralstonia solanacearum PSI07 TaxID=859657 RepID=D8MYC9_RALSL|nr:hypothetical protein [Ralstonia solanacearum]CBJ34345.1 hypothethical protein [Ralstonia solanacearum PSI07]
MRGDPASEGGVDAAESGFDAGEFRDTPEPESVMNNSQSAISDVGT